MEHTTANPQPGSKQPRRQAASRRSRGPRSWSPLQPGYMDEPDEDEYWLEREITLLERALADKGEMRRGELGDLIGCRYWGPGRFARALKEAAKQGRIRRTGIGRYGPAR
jgi:hypothetical protein